MNGRSYRGIYGKGTGGGHAGEELHYEHYRDMLVAVSFE
jgi:hypothetical protein